MPFTDRQKELWRDLLLLIGTSFPENNLVVIHCEQPEELTLSYLVQLRRILRELRYTITKCENHHGPHDTLKFRDIYTNIPVEIYHRALEMYNEWAEDFMEDWYPRGPAPDRDSDDPDPQISAPPA